jgi:hypothetical protein
MYHKYMFLQTIPPRLIDVLDAATGRRSKRGGTVPSPTGGKRATWNQSIPLVKSGSAIPRSAISPCATIESQPMDRNGRVVAADTPHHATQRGNNRQNVFLSDDDRRYNRSMLHGRSL